MWRKEKDFQFFLEILQNLKDLDETDQIGIIHSFSDEYTMGIYLPLLIPLFYPMVMEFPNKITEFKRKMWNK